MLPISKACRARLWTRSNTRILPFSTQSKQSKQSLPCFKWLLIEGVCLRSDLLSLFAPPTPLSIIEKKPFVYILCHNLHHSLFNQKEKKRLPTRKNLYLCVSGKGPILRWIRDGKVERDGEDGYNLGRNGEGGGGDAKKKKCGNEWWLRGMNKMIYNNKKMRKELYKKIKDQEAKENSCKRMTKQNS